MTINIHTPTQTQIIRQCFLETEGYQIIFNLKSLDTTKQDVDLMVEFQLNSHLGLVVVKSQSAFTAIRDLQRLIIYFEEHISQLQDDPDSESYTFLTYGLGFQVQALAGEIRTVNDGEFSIRFMLNVGQTDVESSRTYVGGESVVTLKNIQSFIFSLQSVLIDLG